MQISDKAITALRRNNKAIAALMVAFNIDPKSVEHWLDRKENRLTKPKAVKDIKEGTGLTEIEILDKQTAKA